MNPSPTPGPGAPALDLTVESVLAGEVTADDLRIDPSTLRAQAEVAERLAATAIDQTTAHTGRCRPTHRLRWNGIQTGGEQRDHGHHHENLDQAESRRRSSGSER